MAETDLMTVLGPAFWLLMAALTIALMIGGYWLGGVIGPKTDTGFGGIMVVVLVTFMVAGAVVPLAIFGAMGHIVAIMNPLEPIDEAVFLDQGYNGFARIFLATIVSLCSTIAFFIAAIIGLARGRN